MWLDSSNESSCLIGSHDKSEESVHYGWTKARVDKGELGMEGAWSMLAFVTWDCF
jgi:hypothetical protein